MPAFTFGNWQVTASPECGGNLSCVLWKDHTVTRSFKDPAVWKLTPAAYGFPVLFPPNRIDGGRFVFRGREYFLPVNEPERGNHLHGVALRSVWQMSESCSDGIAMEFFYGSNSPEFSGFPFEFRLGVRYIFNGDVLTQRFEVCNLSSRVMPCALGFHTAFTMPERVFVSGDGGCIETQPPRYLASGRETGWSGGFRPSSWCRAKEIWPYGHFRSSGSPFAELDYGSYRVKYMPDKKFGYWMVWRPQEDTSFLCLEPMNIKVSAMENDPEHLPVAEPGETVCFTSKIQISEV